jgi:hypothetical protein
VTGDNCLSPGQWEIDTYRRAQEGDTLKPGQVAKSGEDGEEETEYRDIRSGPALGHYSSQGGLFNSGSNYNGHQNGGSNAGIHGHQNNGSSHDKSHGSHSGPSNGLHSGPSNGSHAGHPNSHSGHNGDHRRRQKSRKNREPKSETSLVPNAQTTQTAQAV